MLKILLLTLACEASKVYYIPETGTPPMKSVMQMISYNPTLRDIYVYDGRNSDDLAIAQFFAFNLEKKLWRSLDALSNSGPGDL